MTVVSTKLVVKLAAVIDEVPFAWKSVPLGDHALSVSIRKLRFCAGVHVFFSASLKVDALVPLQNTGNSMRVFSAEYDIGCCDVASENVVTDSINTESLIAIASPASAFAQLPDCISANIAEYGISS